jgi:hypothetical protein
MLGGLVTYNHADRRREDMTEKEGMPIPWRMSYLSWLD